MTPGAGSAAERKSLLWAHGGPRISPSGSTLGCSALSLTPGQRPQALEEEKQKPQTLGHRLSAGLVWFVHEQLFKGEVTLHSFPFAEETCSDMQAEGESPCPHGLVCVVVSGLAACWLQAPRRPFSVLCLPPGLPKVALGSPACSQCL